MHQSTGQPSTLSVNNFDNWQFEASRYSESVIEEFRDPHICEGWIQMLQNNLPEGDCLDILDVGGGPGFFTIILSKMGHHVTDLDNSENMLKMASQNLKASQVTATLQLGNCEEMDWPEASFDCIISRNVTWTLDHAERTYEKWLKMLKPGGRILIFDANWNYHYHNEAYRIAHEEDFREYTEIFQEQADTMTEEQVIYRKNRPMCKVKRPQWDLNVLAFLPISRVICEPNISEIVWDSKRKVKYKSTPMFMIRVDK